MLRLAVVAGFLASQASLALGAEKTVRVPANESWTDTGIYVTAGERLEFRASGTIVWGKNGETTDPEGGTGGGFFRPLSEVGVGALIGRVGSEVFFIGRRAQISAPDSGRLELGINDDKVGDNDGSFRVHVRSGGSGGWGWNDEPYSSSGSSSRRGASGEEYFWWRGRVDGSDYLIIQGNTLRVKHLDKRPVQNQDYQFSSGLPDREVRVRLNVIRGRGRVELSEEPSYSNNFTATILLDDSGKHGDDEYEIELTWERPRRARSGYENRTFAGVFRWRGRVDKGVEIEIRGRQCRLLRDQGGQGSVQQSADFSASLPSREVPLNLEKKRGRGRVELVQSPDSSNGYTAIVRIEDEKSGSDTYEFELAWY
jgi:hypothetical protein